MTQQDRATKNQQKSQLSTLQPQSTLEKTSYLTKFFVPKQHKAYGIRQQQDAFFNEMINKFPQLGSAQKQREIVGRPMSQEFISSQPITPTQSTGLIIGQNNDKDPKMNKEHKRQKEQAIQQARDEQIAHMARLKALDKKQS